MPIYAINAILADDDEDKTYVVESESMTRAIEASMRLRGTEIKKIVSVELWDGWELLIDSEPDVDDSTIRRLLGG